MNVVSITTRKPVEGLYPKLTPADLVDEPTYLVCGACGFSGHPTHYVGSSGPEYYEPVCNCPLPAVLEA